MIVRLMEATERDLPLLLKWRNENKQYFLDSREITSDEHLIWWKDKPASDKQFMVYFVIDDLGWPVGTLAVIGDDGAGSVEIGRVILGDKKYARLGIMTEAIKLAVGTVKPDRPIHLRVKHDNTAAIRLYEKCGFRAGARYPGLVVMWFVAHRIPLEEIP